LKKVIQGQGSDDSSSSSTLYRQLYQALIGMAASAEPTGSCVIFSMDRAIQLHALLTSYFAKVGDPVEIHVLYRASSERHLQAYQEVFALFQERGVSPILQKSPTSFRPQLIEVLRSLTTDKLFFLVDDVIFINPVEMKRFLLLDCRDYVPSLRLGSHLRRCYTMNQEQPLPEFLVGPPGSAHDDLTWRWSQGKLDWNYPLSVDGHLFLRKEMQLMAENTDFVTPNTFEGNLQIFRPNFLGRQGYCFKESRVVNIPWNKVQKDNFNLHGSIHQDELLLKWESGLRIRVEKYYGLQTESAHQELEPEFAER